MPIVKIDDLIYRNKITFIYDESDNKVIKYLKDNANYDAKKIVERSSGFFVRVDNDDYYIVVRNKTINWLSTLVHECMHVTSRVLREHGLRLNTATEEAYTYYIQWLFDTCAMSMLKRKKRKKK